MGRLAGAPAHDRPLRHHPHHAVPLPRAGALRRAPRDVPPARQPRPARAGHRPGVQPRGERAHDPGSAFQLGGAGHAAAQRRRAEDRLHLPHRTCARRRRRAGAVAERADLSLCLFGGRALRPRALHAPAARRRRRRAHALGAPVHAHRRAHRHARRAAADEQLHPRALRLCRTRRRRHADAAGDAGAGHRQLPRLRAADDGSGAPAGHGGTLRVRLPVRPGAGPGGRARQGRHAGCRQHPCLAAGVPARRRLGALRPHQQPARRHRAADPRRRGARPAPGRAHRRQLVRPGRRLPGPDGDGAGQPRRRPEPWRSSWCATARLRSTPRG